MGFNSIAQIVDAENSGRTRRYAWRKVPSQATTAGVWFDLALSPGNPIPKFWFDAAPLVAKQVAQSTDGGVYHGSNVSPMQKILRISTAMTTGVGTPIPLILCDYLLYYPTIDDSVTDPQILDNTVALPRYPTGEGVQILPVTLASRTGGQQFYVTYTNSKGVAGRISQIVTQNTVTSVGSITHSNTNTNLSAGPFIGLQSGDNGVQKIESVQMLGGDVGLFALVLVKPLAQTQITGIDAPVEKDYFLETGDCPIIQDDAYLNWICCPQASLSGVPIIGDLQVVWN